MTTINDFFTAARELRIAHPDWRAGQVYFNALDAMESELATIIQGSVLDPFNDDTKITAFLEWLSTTLAVWKA